MALPIALYSTAQVRALDAHAIKELGIPGYTLMKRAGEAALRYLRTRWPTAHRIVIVCGSGNNAGDGYVLARFAQASIVDLTHEIVVHWPAEAGFWLSRSFGYFPPGTVHVAVVDPGNAASSGLLKRLGFVPEGNVDGLDRYALTSRAA